MPRHTLPPLRHLLSVAVVALALTARGATAQPAAFRYSPVWHGGVAGAAVLGSTLVSLAERDDLPECGWCGVDAVGAPDVPAVDRWGRDRLRWGDTHRAAMLSHVTATSAYVLPLVGLAAVHGGVNGEYLRDLSAAASSYAVAQLAADLSKRTFRRSRPPNVFGRAPLDGVGDVHSFISGHSTTSFAAAVAAGTIATRRGSRQAGWIWGTGLTLAAATGYLRIAADRHFLTDVLAGAAVGAAIGALVPRLFDRPRQAAATVRGPGLAVAGVGPVTHFRAGTKVVGTLRVGAVAGGVGVFARLRQP